LKSKTKIWKRWKGISFG